MVVGPFSLFMGLDYVHSRALCHIDHTLSSEERARTDTFQIDVLAGPDNKIIAFVNPRQVNLRCASTSENLIKPNLHFRI